MPVAGVIPPRTPRDRQGGNGIPIPILSMSGGKIHVTVNLVKQFFHENMKKSSEIIKRLMKAAGYETKEKLAAALGMTSSNLSNKQKRGTLHKLIVEESLNKNININWIYTGIGEIYCDIVEAPHKPVAEPQPADATARSCYPEDWTPEQINICKKVKAILESRHEVYAAALKANVDAFHHSICLEDKVDELDRKLDALTARPGGAVAAGGGSGKEKT